MPWDPRRPRAGPPDGLPGRRAPQGRRGPPDGLPGRPALQGRRGPPDGLSGRRLPPRHRDRRAVGGTARVAGAAAGPSEALGTALDVSPVLPTAAGAGRPVADMTAILRPPAGYRRSEEVDGTAGRTTRVCTAAEYRRPEEVGLTTRISRAAGCDRAGDIGGAVPDVTAVVRTAAQASRPVRHVLGLAGPGPARLRGPVPDGTRI